MLQNWLKPVPTSLVQNKRYNSFLRHINIYEDEMPDLSNIQIALIGIEEISANAIRKQLYSLSFPFSSLKIADLGNIRKQEPVFLSPVIKELINGNILPIIIGTDSKFAEAQYQAYHAKRLINLVLVEEKIILSRNRKSDYLNRLINSKKSNLLNLSVIGHQAHFISPESLKIITDHHFEHVSLGNVRSNIEDIEPTIRDADFFSFNISTLRFADAPAQQLASPSGFFTEEACQICRYGGLSDKLTSAGFYGYYPEKDDTGQTAQVMAQMIWYFIDGYYNRKNDFPASTDGLVEYIVEFKDHDEQITFWKSVKSGRWWMQVPVKTKKKYQRHKLVPCSYKDYLSACKEELPDRLLNAYKRFS